jgi:putative hemolysin
VTALDRRRISEILVIPREEPTDPDAEDAEGPERSAA